jgi:hypothetical protein
MENEKLLFLGYRVHEKLLFRNIFEKFNTREVLLLKKIWEMNSFKIIGNK